MLDYSDFEKQKNGILSVELADIPFCHFDPQIFYRDYKLIRRSNVTFYSQIHGVLLIFTLTHVLNEGSYT